MVRIAAGVIAIVFSSLLILPTHAQSPLPQAGAPVCAVSDDPQFALTLGKPVRVGGGAFTVAARERLYLQSLRGPTGQPLTFTRTGQAQGPAGGGIIDAYRVTYDGAAAPITVYIDAYHYEAPKAPMGFTCAAATIRPPPVDPFLAMDLLVRLAIEQGATRDFEPVSLDPDGSAVRGVLFDRFRTMARASRAASASGAPLDPAKPPREMARSTMTLFAFPQTCGGRRVPPTSITITSPQGQALRQEGPLVSGEAAAKLVHGFTPPDGSIAATFGLPVLRASDTVRIGYGEDACDAGVREVALTPQLSAARASSMPQPPLPAGALQGSATLFQVVIDLEGRFQQPSYIGGPEALLVPATTAIKTWRAEPARLNGSPVVADTLLLVRFQ